MRMISKTAFTLIELIVSSLLVAIVILGIFNISMVLNNNNQDYGQRYLVKSQTQITLNHILNNASLATGSAANVGAPSVLDQGILIGAAMGAADNNSFCIHQNNGGDVWVCYVFDPSSHQISYCNKVYNLSDGAGYRGASGACSAAAQFLGSAYSITSTSGTSLASSPLFLSSSTQLLFAINILNCLNNALSSCQASGVSSTPSDNPEVQQSGSIIPLQIST